MCSHGYACFLPCVPTHLWQVSCHLLCKQVCVLSLLHIIQLTEKAGGPLIQQRDNIRLHLLWGGSSSSSSSKKASMLLLLVLGKALLNIAHY
jgi:hypothetical protein